MTTIDALTNAINCTADMHGSVVGDPEFPHTLTPADCICGYGKTIRKLVKLRAKLFRKQRKIQRKAAQP